jgi:hypothetical protein
MKKLIEGIYNVAGDNSFVASPTSIALPARVLQETAMGKTREELEGLQLPSIEFLVGVQNKHPDTKFSLNARMPFPPKPRFVDLAKQAGMLLTSDPKEEALKVTQVTHFKQDWQTPFEVIPIFDFYGLDGNPSPALGMGIVNEMGLAKTEKVTAVQILYKNGDCMSIYMPKKWGDCPSWEELARIEFNYLRFRLRMPQWEDEVILSIIPFFERQFGVKTWTTDKAQFPDIHELAYLFSASQRAKIRVDDHGTEARAVTSFGFKMRGGPIEVPQFETVIIDHPFKFAIGAPTGKPLFVGQMVNDGFEEEHPCFSYPSE